jgi:hypothetical protein
MMKGSDMDSLGFTRSEWDSFSRDGLLVRESVIPQAEIERLIDAIDRQPVDAQWNVVEKDPAFAQFIDHDQHFWLIYDLFGEATKLTRSEYFRRPPGAIQRNRWHFDGPRNLTFQAFGARLPFRVKVAYWLTDLTEPDMGNFTYIPGSHHTDRFDSYHTHEPHRDEVQVRVPAGSISLMWGGLWHRVAPNDSAATRKNLFFEYGPSWIVAGDHVRSDPEWLAGLTQRQRAIMRSYASPNDLVKLPETDVPMVPLEVLRAQGIDVPDDYDEGVPMHLRKFTTRAERWAVNP